MDAYSFVIFFSCGPSALYDLWKRMHWSFVFKIFKIKNFQIIIEKYFPDFFFQKILTKINEKGLSWINLKLRGLKWTKAKLKDWNEIWRNLEGQFYILSLNLL